MNRIDFYSRVRKYEKQDELYHAAASSFKPKYYAKEDLGNGNYRYFYSREEWNAAHKNSGSAADQAAEEAAKRNAYEEYQRELKKAAQSNDTYNKANDVVNKVQDFTSKMFGMNVSKELNNLNGEPLSQEANDNLQKTTEKYSNASNKVNEKYFDGITDTDSKEYLKAFKKATSDMKDIDEKIKDNKSINPSGVILTIGPDGDFWRASPNEADQKKLNELTKKEIELRNQISFLNEDAHVNGGYFRDNQKDEYDKLWNELTKVNNDIAKLTAKSTRNIYSYLTYLFSQMTHSAFDEEDDNYLEHYGTIGQKWGVRHWQNADGTFNDAGKVRYFGSKKAAEKLSDEQIGSLKDYTAKNFMFTNDKHVFKKIKKNPKYYNTGNLTDDEIMEAVRRVEKHPLDPNAPDYGVRLRKELYNTRLQKEKMENEWKVQNQNDKSDYEKELNKILDKKGYVDADDIKYLNQFSTEKIGSSYDHEKSKQNMIFNDNLSKRLGLKNSWDIRTICGAYEELDDDLARETMLKNSDKIYKMSKALDNGNMKKYNKIKDSLDNDYEKNIAETVVNAKQKLESQQKDIENIDNEFKRNKLKIIMKDEDSFSDIYPDNLLKDDKMFNDFKELGNDVATNYEKYHKNIVNQLADRYYEYIDQDDTPISKSEFKKSFSKAAGEILPSGIFDGRIKSKDYEYFFDYNLLNKTFDYIDAEAI